MIADFPAFSDHSAAEILQGGLDLLDQGLTVFDAHGQLLAWNQTFLQLLDFPESLARPGTPLAAFVRQARESGEFDASDDQPGFFEQLAAVDRKQACIREWQRPNGRVLLMRSEPLPHGGFVILYRDITEQRYIENLTEHQNSELEERVRRRTAQLENANANLRLANAEKERMQAALVQAQKMEAIGQLTGGLAHDFNNLLTVIIGNLAALRDHRPDDREVNEFIDPALQSARRGVQLIKRLLTFSRQQPLAPQAVDIELLVNGLATLIRRSLPESITLSTELAPAALHALVDPGQLESALLNFALNSRDAMPDGGELRITARAVSLADDAAAFEVAPGMYALLEVIDNGSGMSAETQARIFEPFFTTKRFGLGSGLGLAMAYGFAKQSGGGIIVHSQPGQGTTVRMVLPLTTPEPAAPSPSAVLPGRQHDELVLLVEDEPNVRQVVRQQLMQLGHPVIEAENGEQAWAMIEQVSAIALVVSDIIMPGPLNGRQLAERIAQQAPHIHIVLMSGYADEDDDQDEAASQPILAKPFLRQDLANALYQSRKDQA